MLKIVQVNIGRDTKSTKLLTKFLSENAPDIVAICEPHTFVHSQLKVNRVSFISNNYNLVYKESNLNRPKAAIMIKKSIHMMIDNDLSSENFAVVLINNLVIVSCYFEPQINVDNRRVDKDIQIDLNRLKPIVEKYSDKKVIILTDSNAKHSAWGNASNHKRGELMFDFIEENQLKLLNDTSYGPTFTKQAIEQNTDEIHTRKSFIDLSLVNENLAGNQIKWSIRDDDVIHTDHKMIEIELSLSISFKEQTINKIDYKNTNWKEFFDTFDKFKPKKFDRNGFDFAIDAHNNAVEKAYELLKLKKVKISEDLPWYNDEISEIRREITRVRRSKSKLNNKESSKFIRLSGILKSLNTEFCRRVKSTVKEFLDRIHKVNSVQEYWSLWKKTKYNYNNQMPIFKENVSKTREENLNLLAKQFIKDTNNAYQMKKIKSNENVPEVTEAELKRIIMNTNNNKTPGPDCITNRLIKLIFKREPKYFVQLYNMILKRNELPDQWKMGRMVYFAKPNRKVSNVTDLRPITLINGFLKIGEALFASRIEDELNRKNFFVENQFGFRQGHSTVSALKNVVKNIKKAKKFEFSVMISLDFSGAFDSLNWNTIINNLIKANIDNSIIKMSQSLLTSRRIDLEGTVFESKRGTPQGGRASPLLYRIGVNNLLCKLNELLNTLTTAYADDTSIIVHENSEKELRAKVKTAIDLVTGWANGAEIQLNSKKTEILSIGKKTIEAVEINNEMIKTTRHLRYLGLMLDDKLLWNKHIEYISNKVNQLTLRIRSMCWMNRSIELKQKLKIYYSVMLPTVLYGFEVWYPDVVNKSTYMHKLIAVQRRTIRSITGAYCNTSTNKLLEITRVIPIDREMEIQFELRDNRSEAKNELKKQMRIDAFNERERIFDFGTMDTMKIKCRETIWCLTESGPFKKYLFNNNLVENDTCRFCNFEIETAHHLLFECEYVRLDRDEIKTVEDFERRVRSLLIELRSKEI